VFIDTTIFVPARSARAPHSAAARAALSQAQKPGATLCISRRVLRVPLSILTRPQTWNDPLPMTQALHDLAGLKDAV